MRKCLFQNAVYIYDWNGRELAVLNEIGMKLVGLKTGKAVRRKLKAPGYASDESSD